MRVSVPVLLVAFGLALAACGGTPPVVEPMPTPPVVQPMPTEPMPAPPMEAPATSMTFDPDTVRAGRFDNGRMFTLDDPPREYFAETYDFRPDDEWYEQVQLGALRFATYCSASFVSGTGLVLTNHHCAREAITQVSLATGEDYNRDGYFAAGRDGEFRVDGLFVEQLISIDDVTAEVEAAADAAPDGDRQSARQAAIENIETERGEAAGEDTRVQVVTLYSGGQYKAYTYKRYDDIRLVFAPETALGYFGGDPDNFTYPRYSLDFALFRAYDADGEPFEPEVFFPFQEDGTEAGDLVFVVGNPGSTTRLQTVAQLEYRRDVTEPAILDFLRTREAAYKAYLDANPDDPLFAEIEDTYFSLGNGRKAYTGRVAGLRDPYIIARRRAAERDYLADLAANAEAQAEYGDIVDQIAANRAAAMAVAPQARAFIGLSPGSPNNGTALSRGFSVVMGNATEEALMEVEQQPTMLQKELIAARMRDLVTYLGADDPLTVAALGGRSPEAAAAYVVNNSVLSTEESVAAAMSGDMADLSEDPAVMLAGALLPALQAYFGVVGPSNAELGELTASLALSRFALYGTSIPPDATFTLRISDGVVKGYPYNGTIAPPYTTIYGLFDRNASFCPDNDESCDWHITDAWMEAEDDLDLSTPYNFVSTNDIIGGNSGSPVLNRDLEVIGIAFDGNIDGLPGNYIFDDRLNRTVSLDVRTMLESLDEVYELDWLVEELLDD